METLKLNPDNKWAKMPRYKKRCSGFKTYILLAFLSLWEPEAVDFVLLGELKNSLLRKGSMKTFRMRVEIRGEVELGKFHWIIVDKEAADVDIAYKAIIADLHEHGYETRGFAIRELIDIGGSNAN